MNCSCSPLSTSARLRLLIAVIRGVSGPRAQSHEHRSRLPWRHDSAGDDLRIGAVEDVSHTGVDVEALERQRRADVAEAVAAEHHAGLVERRIWADP